MFSASGILFQLTFTYSKSTIETLEKGVKYVKKNTRTMSMTSFSSVSIPDFELVNTYPVNICLFKVNNRNTGKKCEICSKLTIKLIMFLLLTLNNQMLAGCWVAI